jgi:hypothetical protein
VRVSCCTFAVTREPGEGDERTQSHAHRHVGVFHHLGELLEADLAVVVLIRFHDGLVHNLAIRESAVYPSRSHHPTISSPACSALQKTHLLQLLVLQVAPDHHLQHNEQLAVADVSVAVNVVDLERKAQLLLLVALAAERAQAGHELLEIDVSASVLVKDGDHAGRQRV